MCLIIYKPAGIEIPSSLIINAYQDNHDGWGIMSQHDNQIQLTKGFSLQSLQTEINNYDLSQELYVHLRKATKGAIALDNCHPFQVTPDLYLMHNGTIDIEINDNKISDTKSFVNLISPMLKNYPDLLKDRGWIKLIESFIADSRIVFLDRKGNNYFINQHLWYNRRGLYLSNTKSSLKNYSQIRDYQKNSSLKIPALSC